MTSKAAFAANIKRDPTHAHGELFSMRIMNIRASTLCFLDFFTAHHTKPLLSLQSVLNGCGASGARASVRYSLDEVGLRRLQDAESVGALVRAYIGKTSFP